jgi:hypothetical protein
MTNLLASVQPARPYSPTPTSNDDIVNTLYGPPPPLPSWVPPNVQNYINSNPAFAEGQRQTLAPPSIAGGEPYSPTPQIDDIRRLFHGRITGNAPTSDQPAMNAEMFKQLMKLPGFQGFTGGTDI